MAMVTVVVPVYNVEEYLPHCLDSLALQSLSVPIEVILVNDGSIDSSSSICERYRKEHPEFTVIHQDNRGLSEARNTGIKKANGDWLFFLDSDDWLAPTAIQTMVEFAERQSCDMVIGSFYYAYDTYLLYDNRWFKGQNPFLMNREEAMRELILQRFFKNFAWGKLYRTEIVKSRLFRSGVFFEDSFWQYLIVDKAQRVGFLPQPLYYYRQRLDSISGSFSARNLDLLRGNESRLLFLQQYYPNLAPLAEKKDTVLVQSFLEYASRDPELYGIFSAYAENHGIPRKSKIERILSLIWDRFTTRRPVVYNLEQ